MHNNVTFIIMEIRDSTNAVYYCWAMHRHKQRSGVGEEL